MLKDRLYRITAREGGEGEHSFRISLDPEDPIFQGHFPGQPVLPGACMMEMGRELLEELFPGSYELRHAKNMKIPAVVDPFRSPVLIFEMAWSDQGNNGVKLRYRVKDEADKVYFKFSGLFEEKRG